MDMFDQITLFLADPETFTTERPSLKYDAKRHAWKRVCNHEGCRHEQFEMDGGYPLDSHTCEARDGRRYVRWMDRPKRTGAFE